MGVCIRLLGLLSQRTIDWQAVTFVTLKEVKTGPRDSNEEIDGDSGCRVWVVGISFALLAALFQLTMDSVIRGTSLVRPPGGDRAPSARFTAGSQTRRGKPAGGITWSPVSCCGPGYEAAECDSKSPGPRVTNPRLGGGLGGRPWACHSSALGRPIRSTEWLSSPLSSLLPALAFGEGDAEPHIWLPSPAVTQD